MTKVCILIQVLKFLYIDTDFNSPVRLSKLITIHFSSSWYLVSLSLNVTLHAFYIRSTRPIYHAPPPLEREWHITSRDSTCMM